MNLVLGLGIAGSILLGWIVLLVAGITSLRRGQRGLGVVLTVVGGLWGVLCLGTVGYGVYQIGQYNAAADFDPKTYEGATGTLKVSWDGSSTLTVRGQQADQAYRLKSENGSFVAPADTYAVRNWEASAQSGQQQTWLLECSYLSDLQHVKLPAKGTVDLGLGPPLTARIRNGTPRGAKKAAFSLEITDAAGRHYTLTGAGRKAKAPGFEVLNAAGAVVWSGDFEYG